MATCTTCGSALPDKARFCGTCGATVEEPAPQAKPMMAKTMIGVPSPLGAPPMPAPAAPAPGQPSAASKTMLGMPAIALPQQPAAAPQPAPAPPPAGASKTMLGVAAPGIAPLAPGQQQPLHQVAAKTMLGVAAPGIAPVHRPGMPVAPAAPADLPPIVPAPPPLAYEPMPEPPPLVSKKGVPMALAFVLAAVVAIVGAVIIVLVVRGGSPIVASPRVGPEGQDQLHLSCDGCPDGTTVHVGSSSASFKTKETDLDLPSPLKVGENPIELALEKPKKSVETVKLVVPVAFRVQPDLSQITAVPPALVVRVEAKPGATVTIDGAPIALDANGSATQTIPIGDDAKGPADEMKTFVKTFAYEVTHDGKSDKGSVKASIPITPLRIDAPTSLVIVDHGPITVTGRAAKGATVMVDGKPATLKPDGSFEAQVDVDADREIDVAAFVAKVPGSPPLGTRTAKIAIQRVKSLDAEGARQDKEYALGYDALASNIQQNLGQPFVVSGTVADARSANHRTLLIVDDQRGCAKSPCIVRVVYGGDMSIVAGDHVRAYGKLAGTVPWQSQQVPEIEAAFVLKGKK